MQSTSDPFTASEGQEMLSCFQIIRQPARKKETRRSSFQRKNSDIYGSRTKIVLFMMSDVFDGQMDSKL